MDLRKKQQPGHPQSGSAHLATTGTPTKWTATATGTPTMGTTGTPTICRQKGGSECTSLHYNRTTGTPTIRTVHSTVRYPAMNRNIAWMSIKSVTWFRKIEQYGRPGSIACAALAKTGESGGPIYGIRPATDADQECFRRIGPSDHRSPLLMSRARRAPTWSQPHEAHCLDFHHHPDLVHVRHIDGVCGDLYRHTTGRSGAERLRDWRLFVAQQRGHPQSAEMPRPRRETNNRDTHYLPRCPGHEIGHQQSVEAGSSHGRLVGIYASRRAKSHDLTDRTDEFQPPSTPHPRRTRFDVMR